MLEEWVSIENLSKAVGMYPDQIQGAGGNTSVKIDEGTMAVKASGIELQELSSENGFVLVHYDAIAEYFQSIIKNGCEPNINYEAESLAVIKRNVVENENYRHLRPSIEAGFHSLLKKYVIHTHSVYANILCCCHEGQSLADEILCRAGQTYEWIDYQAPGFFLTLAIAKHIKGRSKDCGKIFLLKNHGLIVTADHERECIELNQWANETIKSYFGISAIYPKVDIWEKADGLWISQSPYLKRALFEDTSIDEVCKSILFPDQVVFINNNLTFHENKPGKIRINNAEQRVEYACGYKEAKAFEELLIAYCFIVESIKVNKLHICGLCQADIDYIRGMESEKHRQSMMEGMNRG